MRLLCAQNSVFGAAIWHRRSRHVSRSQPSVFKLFAWLTRMAGNKAAHEEEFSEGLAVHLDSLVEQLAIYLFTVPEVIRPRSSPPLSSTVRRVSKVVPRRA